MVRAPRRRQPRRGPWLVAVALLLTAIVLVVAAATGRSSEPDRRLAYLDDVQAVLQRSTADGLEVVDVRNDAPDIGRNDVERRLGQLVEDNKELLRQAERTEPPDRWVAAHGLLLTALSTRATATENLGRVLSSIADGASPQPVAAPVDPVPALVAVGQDLLVGDRAYDLYRARLGDDGRPLPDSRWVPDQVAWQPATLSAFVDQLRASPRFAPNHDVRIVTVGFNPTPVGSLGEFTILAPTRRLNVTVVVQNAGNLPEQDVPIEVRYFPAGVPGGLPTDTKVEAVDLNPGQSRSVSIGPLVVVEGQALLAVSVGLPDVGVPGESPLRLQDNGVGRALIIR